MFASHHHSLTRAFFLADLSQVVLNLTAGCSVCSSWRTALKHHLQHLRPAAFPPSSSTPRGQWQWVKSLDMTMARPKYGGSLTSLCPLAATKQSIYPSALPSHFPNLSVLYLDGQVGAPRQLANGKEGHTRRSGQGAGQAWCVLLD